jgi:hypothetical protein
MGSSVRTGSSALAEVLMSARIAGSVCYYTAVANVANLAAFVFYASLYCGASVAITQQWANPVRGW